MKTNVELISMLQAIHLGSIKLESGGYGHDYKDSSNFGSCIVSININTKNLTLDLYATEWTRCDLDEIILDSYDFDLLTIDNELFNCIFNDVKQCINEYPEVLTHCLS